MVKFWREAVTKFLRDESGQAIVEYVLALSIALTIVTILATTLRRSLFKLWEGFAREISAACPDCPPDPKIRLR
jgi:Flp pilus assembly pilin Flp